MLALDQALALLGNTCDMRSYGLSQLYLKVAKPTNSTPNECPN
jgi:hypothetical protein